MAQTNNEVIDACIQAACLRSASTAIAMRMSPEDVSLTTTAEADARVWADAVDTYARILYAKAFAKPWAKTNG